jgi:hypothetical protein
MSKKDIELGVERLKEIQKEIDGLLVEAEGIVKKCDYGQHWITYLNAALDYRMKMWTMNDTILALEALVN